MYPIALVEFRDAGDTIQKKGIKGHVEAPGEVGI
jgi:hypothetical protein